MPAKFELSLTNVRINDKTLLTYLNTSAGPLWGALDRRASEVQKLAQGKVGVRTGALRASIYKRHLGNFTGQYIVIGSDKSYAKDHHNGTRPHKILASPGGKLSFSAGGRRVFASSVNHPGTKPNPYLTPFLSVFTKPKIVIK
jgi:hypothetical protein